MYAQRAINGRNNDKRRTKKSCMSSHRRGAEARCVSSRSVSFASGPQPRIGSAGARIQATVWRRKGARLIWHNWVLMVATLGSIYCRVVCALTKEGCDTSGDIARAAEPRCSPATTALACGWVSVVSMLALLEPARGACLVSVVRVGRSGRPRQLAPVSPRSARGAPRHASIIRLP